MTYEFFYLLIFLICAGSAFSYYSFKSNSLKRVGPTIAGMAFVLFVLLPFYGLVISAFLKEMPYQEISPKKYETIADYAKSEHSNLINEMLRDDRISVDEYLTFVDVIHSEIAQNKNQMNALKQKRSIDRLKNLSATRD